MKQKKKPKVRQDEYIENLKYWELAMLSYEGGQKYIDKCIVRHPSEGRRTYNRRKQQAFNVNYLSKFVQILSSFVSQGITREFEIGEAKDLYLDKIDFFGTAENFFKRRFIDYILTGDCFALGDAFADQRAYLHNINVLNIMDYKEENGGYVYVDVWVGDNVFRYQKDKVLKSTIENYNFNNNSFEEVKGALAGFIPLVSANGCLTPQPAYFRDAISISRNIFEQINSIAFQYSENGFPILVHPPKRSDLETFKKPVTDPTALETTSTAQPADQREFDPKEIQHIAVFDKNTVVPSWISPSINHLSTQLEFVQQQVRWMMSMLNIYNENLDISGDAKSYDYSLMVGVLKEFSKTMQEFETNTWWMLAQFDERIANNWENIKIRYPKEFDVKALKNKLDEYGAALSFQIGKTFDSEIKNQIAASFIQNDEILTKIKEEIESQKETPVYLKEGEEIEE